jgi:hypothetical protein
MIANPTELERCIFIKICPCDYSVGQSVTKKGGGHVVFVYAQEQLLCALSYTKY